MSHLLVDHGDDICVSPSMNAKYLSDTAGDVVTVYRNTASLIVTSTPSWKAVERQVELRHMRLQRNLEIMSNFKDGWDSYSAPAPSAHAITSGKHLLNELRPFRIVPTKLGPSGDGGVVLECSHRGFDYVIDIYNDGVTTVLKEIDGAIISSLESSTDKLPAIAAKIAEGRI
jgi:hypothetical protein